MKGFRFYSKSDSDKETIGTWVFNSKQEAYKGFAEIKKLSEDQFRNLFIVERHDKNRS